MERRYKIQCTPFYCKNWCTGPFYLNSPRNSGWYQARVHPFSSGNGKGDNLGMLPMRTGWQGTMQNHTDRWGLLHVEPSKSNLR